MFAVESDNDKAISKDLVANPQGKGLVGILADWDYSAPRSVVAKPAPQLLADYFTSLLVLSASFKFEPVFGKTYYLYCEHGSLLLSLISPDEWAKDAKRRAYVGECVLHGDATWSISPSDNISHPGDVADAVAAVYEGFVEKLHSENALEDELPFFEQSLPYYPRLFAAALSRSIRASLILGDQLGTESRDWLKQIPRDAGPLLSYSITSDQSRLR